LYLYRYKFSWNSIGDRTNPAIEIVLAFYRPNVVGDGVVKKILLFCVESESDRLWCKFENCDALRRSQDRLRIALYCTVWGSITETQMQN
jgi:hypothetical protein